MNNESFAERFPRTRPASILSNNLAIIENFTCDAKILDVGCAEGRTIQWLRTIFGNCFSYYGVDLSEVRINKARGFGIANTTFIVDDAENLHFENETFDFVMCSQVIEHVPDEAQMLNEISRVLKINCNFQLDTVYKKKWAFYFRRSPSGWALDPTHLREYTDVNSLTSKFPESLEIKDIHFEKCLFRINSISLFSFLPDSIKIWIPGYYIIFVSGTKRV